MSLDRFWMYVQKTDGCWLWTGARQQSGYGLLKWGDKYQRAHRLSWFIHHGELPPSNVFVCHTCDVPACVNPEHLFLGTADDNNKDRARKGRNNSPRGERHGRAKLSRGDVTRLRESFAQGERSAKELALQFSISLSQVYRILNGQKWGSTSAVEQAA
jgi:hypothetical protein